MRLASKFGRPNSTRPNRYIDLEIGLREALVSVVLIRSTGSELDVSSSDEAIRSRCSEY